MSDYDNMSKDCVEVFARAIQSNLRRSGLEELAQTGAILDIACADGKLLAELARSYPEAQYFGLSSQAEKAKKNNPHADIRGGSIQQLPFPDGTMTIATSTFIYDYAEETRSASGRFGIGERIKPSTFKLRELVNETYRVLAPVGLYIPIEDEIQKYFSEGDSELFGEGFESLECHTPSSMRIFRKVVWGVSENQSNKRFLNKTVQFHD